MRWISMPFRFATTLCRARASEGCRRRTPRYEPDIQGQGPREVRVRSVCRLNGSQSMDSRSAKVPQTQSDQDEYDSQER